MTAANRSASRGLSACGNSKSGFTTITPAQHSIDSKIDHRPIANHRKANSPKPSRTASQSKARTAKTGGHFSFCWYICWYRLFHSLNKYNKYSILRLQCVSRSVHVIHQKAPDHSDLGLFCVCVRPASQSTAPPNADFAQSCQW